MGKKKILLIAAIVAPVLLIVALVAVGTRFFKQPLAFSISLGAPPAAAAPPPVAAPAAPAHEEGAPGAGILVDLGSKVVNLADPGGYRYLKVGVVLELARSAKIAAIEKAEERAKAEEEVGKELLARRALIDDTLISCLSNKTFGDIFSVEGKQTLREELLELINERLDPEFTLVNIYFTDFVIN